METTAAASVKKDAGRNAAQVQEKKKSGAGKAVGILLVLVLLAGVSVFAAFGVLQNLFGLRDGLLSWLQSMDPAYTALQQREQDASALEEQLTKLQTELEAKKQSLDRRAASLDERQKLLDSGGLARTAGSLRLFADSLSEKKLAELRQVGLILSDMPADAAAAALGEMPEIFDRAIVVYFMDPQKAAGVLTAMDREPVAEIIAAILG